jgi:hypothetical protein
MKFVMILILILIINYINANFCYDILPNRQLDLPNDYGIHQNISKEIWNWMGHFNEPLNAVNKFDIFVNIIRESHDCINYNCSYTYGLIDQANNITTFEQSSTDCSNIVINVKPFKFTLLNKIQISETMNNSIMKIILVKNSQLYSANMVFQNKDPILFAYDGIESYDNNTYGFIFGKVHMQSTGFITEPQSDYQDQKYVAGQYSFIRLLYGSIYMTYTKLISSVAYLDHNLTIIMRIFLNNNNILANSYINIIYDDNNIYVSSENIKFYINDNKSLYIDVNKYEMSLTYTMWQNNADIGILATVTGTCQNQTANGNGYVYII